MALNQQLNYWSSFQMEITSQLVLMITLYTCSLWLKMESNIKNMDGYLVIPVSLLILIGPKTVNICKVTLEIMKSFIVSERSILRQLKEQDLILKKSRCVKNNYVSLPYIHLLPTLGSYVELINHQVKFVGFFRVLRSLPQESRRCGFWADAWFSFRASKRLQANFIRIFYERYWMGYLVLCTWVPCTRYVDVTG